MIFIVTDEPAMVGSWQALRPLVGRSFQGDISSVPAPREALAVFWKSLIIGAP